MGVLNVTPDSFSDGGLWLDPEAAIRHGMDMAERGASIIDVGGESTRPGARPVSEQEELRRVLPVVETLSRALAIPISIDTRKPAVARKAIEAGASIINDTLGEDGNGAMDPIVHETGAGVVIMHSRGTAQTMRSLTEYDDVVLNVRSFLETRAKELESAGVSGDRIIVDPGFGFGKDWGQNLELLRRLGELRALGRPILAGTSRKRTIGHVLGLLPEERLEGTAATVTLAIANGADIVRVHDVPAMVRVARMTDAVVRGVPDPTAIEEAAPSQAQSTP